MPVCQSPVMLKFNLTWFYPGFNTEPSRVCVCVAVTFILFVYICMCVDKCATACMCSEDHLDSLFSSPLWVLDIKLGLVTSTFTC